jgi:hypothetical protein
VSVPVPSDPSAELRARVLDAARNDAVPPRAAGARRRALVVGLGFAVMFAIGAAGGGPQLRGRPVGSLRSSSHGCRWPRWPPGQA